MTDDARPRLRTVRVHWSEDQNRSQSFGDWTGPQRFYEGDPPPANAYHTGIAVSLPYDEWQALGGPLDLIVRIAPAADSPYANHPASGTVSSAASGDL